MSKLSLKIMAAQLIDLIVSAGFVKFIFSIFDIDCGLHAEIILLITSTITLFLTNNILSGALFKKTLGETIFGLERIKKWQLSLSLSSFKEAQTSIFKKIFNSILSLLIISAPMFTDQFIDQFGTSVTGITNSNLKWKPYEHPEELWKIEFPTKPLAEEKNIHLPDSQKITISEIVAKEESLAYSVSTTKLPSSITKWSPNLVLKGCFKVVEKNTPKAESTTEKIFKYKNNHPTLPYSLTEGDQFVSGRLILIGDTLYKLEVKIPTVEKEHHKEKLTKFFNSFSP